MFAAREDDIAAKSRREELNEQQSALYSRSDQIEQQMSEMVAISVAGLMAQAELADDILQLMGDKIAGIGKSMVDGIERLQRETGHA